MTFNDSPMLSIVMPNYNHAPYLRQSLGAILNQSFRSFEVIVTDDASTDDSLSVLRAMAADDSRVRLIRNEQNTGPLVSSQRALEICNGEYVYFASADDMIHPGFFEKAMTLLGEHPAAGLCVADFDSFDGQQYRFYLNERATYFSTSALTELCCRIGSFPALACAAIIKRDAMLAAGGLRTDLGALCDCFVVLLIAIRHGVCYLPESVMSVRRKRDSYGTGLFAWKEQKRIGNCLQSLLYSEGYKDVLYWSRKTGFWLPLQPYLILMLLKNPREWRFISLRVLIQALWNTTKTILAPSTPLIVKRTIASFRDRYWKVSRA